MDRIFFRISTTIFLLFFPLFSQSQEKLSVKDFTTETQLFDAQISPNGKYLASIWNKNGRRVVTLKDLSQNSSKVKVLLNDIIYRAYEIDWANEDMLLVHLEVPANTKRAIRKSKNKDFDINDYFMYYRIMAMNIYSGESVELLGDYHKFEETRDLSVITNFLIDDPDHIIMKAYSSNRYALYKVNIKTGKWKEVAKGGFSTFKIISDRDGTPLYRLDYLKYSKRIEIYELDSDSDWNEVESIELDHSDNEKLERGALLSIVIGDSKNLYYRKRNLETGF